MSEYDSCSYGGDEWDGGEEGGGGGGGGVYEADPHFPLLAEELLLPAAAMATGVVAGAAADRCKNRE